MKTHLLSVTLIILAVMASACNPVQTTTAAPSTPLPTAAPASIPSPTTSPVINLINVEGSGVFVQPDGTVTISLVSAFEPSWICIQADQDKQPGEILGCAAVPAGENTDVAVKVDLKKLTRVMHTVLYADRGTPGQMEIPNPDVPALTTAGAPVSFSEFLVGDLSWITVEDQMLSEGNTVVIPRVYTPIPALLVIHDGERSPFVIGWATLQAGENLDVIVTLTSPSKTNNLGAMLHWDGGETGYQSFLLDPDARTQTGEVLVVQFQLK